MAPGLFPAAFRGPEGTVAVYFETAVITVLVLLGQVLEEGVLQIAASIETASEHPLAWAIVDAASRRGIVLAAVSGFDSPTGKGRRRHCRRCCPIRKAPWSSGFAARVVSSPWLRRLSI